MPPRYVVGIDLGTTNSAVAYADAEAGGEIRMFPIPQTVAEGQVEARSTLPSFLLLPTEVEVAPGALALPWDPAPGVAVGTLARDRGADLPHRSVWSAKSWLSHTGVDRTARILPWRGTDQEEDPHTQVSPVEASALLLDHVRNAWNHAQPEHPLEEQQVYLTVPASFDAVARELTVQAAGQAGLANITLLEEPQAAFYSWLASSGEGWRRRLKVGDTVLVCDIGGGTTDFTLIAVIDDGAGNLALERVAVGDHILLGGDNMDLTLAHAAMQKLGDKLSSLQQRALVHACRRAKEQLLAADAPETAAVSVLGRGSKLIGATARVDLPRDHVHRLILDGFFPWVDAAARPGKRRAVGLKELGLPYAHDPAVTRHLAEFLARHGRAPTAVLFNGGVMKAEPLRARVSQVAGGWLGHGNLPALEGTDLDLAVAHGAAYYGLVRRGKGVRIRGGIGRSYYIGIEAAMPAIPGFAPPVKAMCLAPFGMEEGSEVALPDEELGLVVGETAEFRFFASTERKDPPGTLVDPEEAQLDELDPVETLLPPGDGAAAGDAVPVSLAAHVTEVGTLELWCVAKEGKGRWKLEYTVRER